MRAVRPMVGKNRELVDFGLGQYRYATDVAWFVFLFCFFVLFGGLRGY